MPTALAAQISPLEASVNNIQQLLNEQIQKSINIPNSPPSQLLSILNKQPSNVQVQSTALTKDLSDLSSGLSSIQTALDEVFSIVENGLVSANLTADVLQESVISPLLTLINALSGMSLVQSVDSVYAAVLVVQTVLTVANTSLATFVSLANGGTSIIDTVQGVVDQIFTIVLAFLPSS